MHSATPLELIRLKGSPRFLGLSFSARLSQPPRITLQTHSLIESLETTGFTFLGRLAVTIFGCNEAEADSLALRLTDSIPRASPERITPTGAGSTTC
jgi:hypothetical protein